MVGAAACLVKEEKKEPGLLPGSVAWNWGIPSPAPLYPARLGTGMCCVVSLPLLTAQVVFVWISCRLVRLEGPVPLS